MNNVSLTGRLTREPELRYGGQDNSTDITRFTLAVDDGKDTDFINIKCFGRTAEWAQKWLSKGSRAEVAGKIKTGSYESQRTGSKVYYTEVVANSVGFGESKAEAEARGQQLELKGMTDEQQRTYLESIRRTRFKTLIMTAHIDKAVEEIERRREAAGRGVEYKAFEMYFVQGMDYAEIAEELDTGKNTPRRWVTGIINELSVLLWGIDEERVK